MYLVVETSKEELIEFLHSVVSECFDSPSATEAFIRIYSEQDESITTIRECIVNFLEEQTESLTSLTMEGLGSILEELTEDCFETDEQWELYFQRIGVETEESLVRYWTIKLLNAIDLQN